MRRLLPLLLALGALSACTAAPGASAPAAPVTSPEASGSRSGGDDVVPLAFQACGAPFECAVLPVPLAVEDQDADGDADADGHGDAGTVDLAVLRRPATGDRIGVLVVNPGGPGVSAVEHLRRASELVPERVRSRFDLVAFDPRGVGESEPVVCASDEELDALFALDSTPEDAQELQQYAEAQAELARGCERESGRLLPHVSTAAAAADMDRLRAALGEERLSYLGYSYGTALGAAYLAAYPQRVRAAVLDGGVDPALTWDAYLQGQSGGFDAALEAFVADCAAQGCAFRAALDGRATTAQLLAAYDRLVEQVDAEPLPTQDPDGRSLGPGELEIGVVSGLYDRTHGWPALAEALAEAVVEGEGTQLLALSDAYLERGPEGYSSVSESHLAVICLDRPWPRETAPYVALAERLRERSPRFGPSIALSALACASWPVPPAATPAPVSAPGAPEVLVIGTTGDPATPFAWSVALAQQLDSPLLTHRGEGHTVYYAGGPACVLDVADAHLLTGAPPEPTTC